MPKPIENEKEGRFSFGIRIGDAVVFVDRVSKKGEGTKE